VFCWLRFGNAVSFRLSFEKRFTSGVLSVSKNSEGNLNATRNDKEAPKYGEPNSCWILVVNSWTPREVVTRNQLSWISAVTFLSGIISGTVRKACCVTTWIQVGRLFCCLPHLFLRSYDNCNIGRSDQCKFLLGRQHRYRCTSK